MAGRRRIDLDPVGGIAGDMFAAAMLDALPSLEDRVRGHLSAVGVPDGVRLSVSATTKAGFRGTRFVVEEGASENPPRTFAAMASFLEDGALEPEVAKIAVRIFRLLAEAEAHVHGKSIDAIHFHEVSDWDSVVDIVAAASLVASMDDATWRISALPLGGGTVATAHGHIPVPAPATAELLKGYAFHDDGVDGERVTPTGAAIVRYLCDAPGSREAPTTALLQNIGIGCGTRDLDGRANILRVAIYEQQVASGEDTVERLAFEIDDMTGEELALALDRLRAMPGVLDVSQVPMIGKKGRAMSGVRLLVTPEKSEHAIDACLTETSTLGVRRQSVRRRVLARATVSTDVAEQQVPVKRAERPDGTSSAKADSDALASTPNLSARRALAARASHAALGDDDER